MLLATPWLVGFYGSEIMPKKSRIFPLFHLHCSLVMPGSCNWKIHHETCVFNSNTNRFSQMLQPEQNYTCARCQYSSPRFGRVRLILFNSSRYLIFIIIYTYWCCCAWRKPQESLCRCFFPRVPLFIYSLNACHLSFISFAPKYQANAK